MQLYYLLRIYNIVYVSIKHISKEQYYFNQYIMIPRSIRPQLCVVEYLLKIKSSNVNYIHYFQHHHTNNQH